VKGETEVDIISFSSVVARNITSRFINKAIEKKTGINPGIKLNRFELKSGGTAKADLSIEMPSEQFEQILEVIFDDE
jgi:hypothetical protein